MKHTKEEIVNALKVIKDTCRDNTSCATCPFWNAGETKRCMIKDDVETWEIADPEPKLWRAFK